MEEEQLTVVVVTAGLRKEGDKVDIYRKAALLVRNKYRNRRRK